MPAALLSQSKMASMLRPQLVPSPVLSSEILHDNGASQIKILGHAKSQANIHLRDAYIDINGIFYIPLGILKLNSKYRL